MRGMHVGRSQQPGYRLLLNATSLLSIFYSYCFRPVVTHGTASRQGVFLGSMSNEEGKIALHDSVNHFYRGTGWVWDKRPDLTPKKGSSLQLQICVLGAKATRGPSGTLLQFATLQAIASKNPGYRWQILWSGLTFGVESVGSRGAWIEYVRKATLPELLRGSLHTVDGRTESERELPSSLHELSLLSTADTPVSPPWSKNRSAATLACSLCPESW
ncbi:hypothetical protein NLG97_g5758 [Lecanicillium saksenae]|uniref:Uncharacterized protein n=1 Tax=Lecanicillium saksenae TaxID=468837 RepID=A0ACC1QUR1_9HYPO|nr:hypothetical protein NLG97_g5758 [Lecanicillium saksenae]